MDNLELNKILQIGIALSSNEDSRRLMEIFLDAAMALTLSDSGILYVLKENSDSEAYTTVITKNASGDGRECIKRSVGSLNDLCAESVSENCVINISDCGADSRITASEMEKYVALMGGKPLSVLVAPMRDHKGEVDGVLQLFHTGQGISDGNISYSEESERNILALASLGAIHLENLSNNREITKLLESMVQVLSTAIDARSPYNANHTRNMARYAENFLHWLRDNAPEYAMTQQEENEFLMAVWLHDIGKLVIPLRVMDKATRLAGREEQMLRNLERIELLSEVRYLKGEITQQSFEKLKEELEDAAETVRNVNDAGYILPEELLEKVKRLSRKTYTDRDGSRRGWFTEEEIAALSVRRGTLTQSERYIMQDHVVMTEKLLDQMHFSNGYRHVPEWAVNHHEYLDGTGYPKKLTAKDLSFPMRLLTIIDIFDAMTAKDRPYKHPMPDDEAIAILADMAKAGQIDAKILKLFTRSGAWR